MVNHPDWLSSFRQFFFVLRNSRQVELVHFSSLRPRLVVSKNVEISVYVCYYNS